MTSVRRELIFGDHEDNVSYLRFALQHIHISRTALGDDNAHPDERARCYKNLERMRVHFGMRAVDDEFRQVALFRATRSSMPETFVVDVTKIIESYI